MDHSIAQINTLRSERPCPKPQALKYMQINSFYTFFTSHTDELKNTWGGFPPNYQKRSEVKGGLNPKIRNPEPETGNPKLCE